jgi:uncharacterized protein YndB with AHSA1/START domain
MSTKATETSAVRRSVTVDCSVDHAFETFTERMHEWWPLHTYSIEVDEGGGAPETVLFQGGAGGQVYERTTKGEELKWADVLAWEPPHRLVLAWSPVREERIPTQIEVRFTEEGGKTRVDLEHRGWEKLGERGVQMRRGYASGWISVLGAFAESASS